MTLNSLFYFQYCEKCNKLTAHETKYGYCIRHLTKKELVKIC